MRSDVTKHPVYLIVISLSQVAAVELAITAAGRGPAAGGLNYKQCYK